MTDVDYRAHLEVVISKVVESILVGKSTTPIRYMSARVLDESKATQFFSTAKSTKNQLQTSHGIVRREKTPSCRVCAWNFQRWGIPELFRLHRMSIF